MKGMFILVFSDFFLPLPHLSFSPISMWEVKKVFKDNPN